MTNNQTVSEDMKSQTGKHLCLWILLMLLPFVPLVFFIIIKGWTWVPNNWDKVLGVVFGIEGVATFIFADIASQQTAQKLDEIRCREEKIDHTLAAIQKTEALLANDVVNLEDATRRNLSGFAEIFDRSIWLLENAEHEIVYANFALGFGNPHKQNEFIANKFANLQYKKSDWPTFTKAVDKFWTTLQDKAATITKLKVITLTQNRYKAGFIDRLSEREGYEYLKDESTQKAICTKEKAFRAAFIKTLQARDGQKEGEEQKKLNMTEEWRIGDSLPIQILIARLSGEKDSAKEARRGCVVFLLGTESIGGIKRIGAETGFYTELPHIVQMYEDLISNVAEKFEIKYPLPDDN